MGGSAQYGGRFSPIQCTTVQWDVQYHTIRGSVLYNGRFSTNQWEVLYITDDGSVKLSGSFSIVQRKVQYITVVGSVNYSWRSTTVGRRSITVEYKMQFQSGGSEVIYH